MRAKRSLGQNFLVDPNLQRKIVGTLEAGAGDTVVEIGPGQGALTNHLAGNVRRLIAIELDDSLARELRRRFQEREEVTIIHGDALHTDLAGLVDEPDRLRIIGNIPYNITTPLLFHLFGQRPAPAAIVLMVQNEVADRIVAEPGGKTYGALSVGARLAAHVEKRFTVSRNAFRPVPDVDSAILHIRPHKPPRMSASEEVDLRSLTRATFGQRRKQLQKILRSHPDYGLDPHQTTGIEADTGLDLRARPETLTPEDFLRLSRALRAIDCPTPAV